MGKESCLQRVVRGDLGLRLASGGQPKCQGAGNSARIWGVRVRVCIGWGAV